MSDKLLLKISSTISAISLFLVALPYYIWENLAIVHFFSILMIITSYAYIDYRQSRNTIFLIAILILIVLWSLLDSNLKTIFRYLLLVEILLLQPQYLLIVYNKLKNIFSGILCISLMLYVLVIWIGIDLPHSMHSPLNPVKAYDYVAYMFFLIVPNSVYSFANYRFGGVFDEAGVVGTFSAFFLVAERYHLKRFTNIVFLISGIFSFSLYFFIISLGYMLYILFIDNKKILLVIMFLLISGITVCLKDDPIFDRLVFSRFAKNENGMIGESRIPLIFEEEYSKFIETPAVFVGVGVHKVNEILEGGSSYKSIIFSKGILFFILILLFYTLHFYINLGLRKDFFIFFIFILTTIYQRPIVLDTLFFYLCIAIPYKFRYEK